MRTLKSLRSVFCTFLAMVVFSLTISITLASPKSGPENQDYSVSKKNTIPTNTENQLPYEERETENDDELQDNFPLVCILSEPLFFTPIKDQNECCNKDQDPTEAVTDIPLYLSQRVLLI